MKGNTPPQAFWGNANSVLPARIAYFLNLQGPAVAVDTACSSSLIAIHFACQGLWNKETDMGLAGGVLVMNTPRFYLLAEKAQMLSPTGCCHAFDEKADGFVPGEGAGAIVLKRLDDAVADGDHIYGVIRGSGINQDGTTNGITAPSALSQERLERYVYDTFNINPGQIQMVEAHGTGTKLGDPIEFGALTHVFRHYTDKKRYCAIGSIKTNLGHTQSTAGVAGVIKVLLSLKHKKILPSLHFDKGNSHINFDETPFYVNTMLKDWDIGLGEKRCAVVSSFGISGTNAHMVIEETGIIERRHKENAGYLVVLSARTDDQLRQQVEQLIGHCEEESELDCGNLSYTLLVGRKHFNHRLSCVVRNKEELLDLLKNWLEIGKVCQVYASELKKDHQDQPSIKRYGNECIQMNEKIKYTKEYIENLSAIADLFVLGYELDYENLFVSGGYSRISLPTYPFAKERYWIEESEEKKDISNGAAEERKDTEIKEEYELMTFEEVWQEREIAERTGYGGKTVVCFLTGEENRRIAVEKLNSKGQETKIIFIKEKNGNQKEGPEEYSVIADDPESYKEAFSGIKKEKGVVDAIIYLWPLENRENNRDYTRIISILQGAAYAGIKPERYILCGKAGDDLDRCYLESWIGFERSIGMAMPKTQITGIYEEAEGETGIEIWLERVRKELKEKQGGSVLYRGRKRHICRIQETNIETGEEMIKKGGAYLITGGFGGLGILFAEHLAKTKGANIILTGRSGMDEDKERKIKGLEKAGGNVMYREADVCDVGRMKEVFGEGKRRFGRIDGIIHAAGISAGGSIFNKGIKDFENVLSPKVKGTIALDEMLKGEGIDFICYFASSSGILGDFGSCDYAVGNRFQMSYGGYMNRPGDEGKRVVINWPLWREGGMGFNDLDSAGMYLKSSGQRLLEKEEGIEIFERLLSQKKTQHLVIAGQRSRVERYLRGIEGREIEADDKVISGYTGIGRRAGMKGLSVEECIEWDIKEQIRGMLKIKSEKLGREENLAEFGFDSISLGQFAKNLSVYYGIEITPAVFYGYSTIGKLTGYLHKEYAEKMKTFYAEESAPRNDMRKIAVNWESRPMIKRESRPELRDDYKGNMEKIAIIGMSGRFPESGNVEEMWKILAEGREVIKDYPVERMKGKMRADSGWRCGCVPGVDEFDPLFFEISPREAEVMDPRQRLLLEESWKALEDAGYGPEQIKKGKIGMFVGVEQGGYQYLTREKASITSNHDGILAARLAYFLGFDGPVMAINTACSSGLVAAHQACMSLRNGECETAIAAGVNLILMPEMFGVMKQAGMLSPEGKCYAFDKRANGLAAGEAVAVVVLKRLCLAQEEGDPIYGIIRGSGINYDGKTNGITAPNGVAQSELYKTVYDKSGVNPEEIEYIVTHGTGTILGDPVEVNALNDVFKAYTKKEGYCALTSTKTNFGHSFAASGLLSLISLIEAFRHEMIPASLNCAEENEYIQWKGSPFYINKKNKEWKSKEGKSRMGAVSAFGMSGTNAHMVVESCTEEEGKEGELPYVLIALSARSPESLQERIGDMIHVLESKEWGGNELSRMSYTLIEGREHFDHRLAVVVKDREDAIEALKRAGRNETIPNLFRGKVSHEFKEQKAIEQYTKELVGQARISVRERGNMPGKTQCVSGAIYTGL